jgi:hypothetical protein
MGLVQAQRRPVCFSIETSQNKEYVQLNDKDAVLLIDIMRRKAIDLNALFGTVEWTPRMVDMILWATRDAADAHCLS